MSVDNLSDRSYGLNVKTAPSFSPNNCAVIEQAGDGTPCGRCWYYVKDGQCPRHGDVRAVQGRYVTTGKLTMEREVETLRRQASVGR